MNSLYQPSYCRVDALIQATPDHAYLSDWAKISDKFTPADQTEELKLAERIHTAIAAPGIAIEKTPDAAIVTGSEGVRVLDARRFLTNTEPICRKRQKNTNFAVSIAK